MASQKVLDQLKRLTLKEVVLLNEELGRGTYGKVFTVNYRGSTYAAKEIHSLLLHGVSQEEKKAVKDSFLLECYHSSLIHHPNIVQFIGIYYAKQSDIPIMAMELMDKGLSSFIENNKSKIAMDTKLSILHDVSLGLCHLLVSRSQTILRASRLSMFRL